MSMISRFLFLLFFIVNQTYSQQNNYHFIIQNKAQERLPYASLSWFKAAGFSANAAGVVSVSVDTPIDSVIVSTIGYKTLYTSISDLEKRKDSFVITLTTQEDLLPPVTIFSAKRDSDIGIQDRQTSFISNNYRGLIGAVKVNQPGKICKIESISIFVHKKSAKNIPFRIRVFAVAENGYPAEDLLRESIVIDSYNVGEWNSIALSESNIFIEQPVFFIGLEWLNQPEKIGKGALQIGLTDKLSEAYSYFRFANREWRLPKYANQSSTDNLMIKAKIIY